MVPGKDHRLAKGVVLGVILVLLLLPVGAYLYMRFGPVPVAVADTPFPDEEQIVHIALDARINRQLTSPPIAPTPENLTAGAHVFVRHCAICHGTPNRTSDFGLAMYPTVPQLWKRKDGIMGVSEDPPGVTYWKVDNGIRLTGMPSFKHILSTEEMWQVSLLLAAAGKPLPVSAQQVIDDVKPNATLTGTPPPSHGSEPSKDKP